MILYNIYFCFMCFVLITTMTRLRDIAQTDKYFAYHGIKDALYNGI